MTFVKHPSERATCGREPRNTEDRYSFNIHWQILLHCNSIYDYCNLKNVCGETSGHCLGTTNLLLSKLHTSICFSGNVWHLLIPLQEECLWQYECTLGAPITNPDSDHTDSVAKRGPTRGAVLLAVEGDVSKSYYCRTAPSYNDAKPTPKRGMCKGLSVTCMLFLQKNVCAA